MKKVIRLNPDDPFAWKLWPALERRMRDTMAELTPETVYSVVETPLRLSFAGGGPGTLFLAVLDMGRMEITGHALGWLENAWGTHYGFIHHAQTDEPLDELWRDVVIEMGAWVEEMNAMGLCPKVEAIRWATGRGDGWARKFEGHTETHRSIMTIPVETLIRVKGNGRRR